MLCWPDRLNLQSEVKLLQPRWNKINRKQFVSLFESLKISHYSTLGSCYGHRQPEAYTVVQDDQQVTVSKHLKVLNFYLPWQTRLRWLFTHSCILSLSLSSLPSCPRLSSCSPSLPIKGLSASSRSAQCWHTDGGRRDGDRWAVCLTVMPLDMSIWRRMQTLKLPAR